MRTMWRIIAVLAVVTACHSATAPKSDPPPPPDVLTGVWQGTNPVASLTLANAPSTGVVQGSGTLSALAVTVSGTYAPPHFSLTIAASGYESVNYTGTRSGNSLSGTLVGSGWTGQPYTMTLTP